jgi:hypothetical protein
VLAALEAGIDRSAGERLALGALSCPAALDRSLQAPARILVIEKLRAALNHHLADDLGHGLQIVAGIKR